MSRRALLIGGGGQVGRVVARDLISRGWQVAVLRRSPNPSETEAEVIVQDRNAEGIDAVLARGFDLVVDLVAFRAEQVAPLIRNADSLGSVVLMSSAAVYVDGTGLSLQDASAETCPVFDAPLDEAMATVAPGHDSYAGRKREVEEALLGSAIPTTVLRPAGIHGPHSPQPREWFYVRRAMDGRDRVVLGHGGRSSLHPASVFNIAEMIHLAAERPGDRILNAGDPGYPDEREISSAIAAAMGIEQTRVLLPGPPPIASPFSLPVPFFLNTDAAGLEIGYAPVTTYAEAAQATCDWIAERHRANDLVPNLDARFGPPGLGSQTFAGRSDEPFDYAAEDAAIAALVPDDA